jgi:hypothetical protein
VSMQEAQKNQTSVTECDLGREAGDFFALFITIYKLRHNLSTSVSEIQQRKLLRVEEALRERGDQVGLTSWVLSLFPCNQNDRDQTYLTLQQECEYARKFAESSNDVIVFQSSFTKLDDELKSLKERKNGHPRQLDGSSHRVALRKGDSNPGASKPLDDNELTDAKMGGVENDASPSRPEDWTRVSQECAGTDEIPAPVPSEGGSSSSCAKEMVPPESRLQAEKMSSRTEGQTDNPTTIPADLEATQSRLDEIIERKESELCKSKERLEKSRKHLRKTVHDWLTGYRFKVACPACKLKHKVPWGERNKPHECTNVECGSAFRVSKAYWARDLESELQRTTAEPPDEQMLADLWVVEAEALDFLVSLAAEASPPVSSSLDEVSKWVRGLEEGLDDYGKGFLANIENVSKKEMRKNSQNKVQEFFQLFRKQQQDHVKGILSQIQAEKQKDKDAQIQERLREVKESWADYEANVLDSSHPMLHLRDLNVEFCNWLGEETEFALSNRLRHQRDRQCFPNYDKLLKNADSVDTKARLRLALQILECIQFELKHVEINHEFEDAVKSFCHGVFKNKMVSFIPVLTMQAAEQQDMRIEKAALLDPNQDRPRVQYLGYQVKRTVNGVKGGLDVVDHRKLTVQYPQKLTPISSIARKLRHLIEEDRYSHAARETLRQLGHESGCEGFESLKPDDPFLKDMRELVAFLINYVGDSESGKLVALLIEELREKGFSLETESKLRLDCVKKQPPSFCKSDIAKPRAFLLRFLKVDEEQQKTIFESPFFEYPADLSDGLVGLLADNSLWTRLFRERCGDDAAAALQNVVNREYDMLEDPSQRHRHGLGVAVVDLLGALLQGKSKLERKDDVDGKVQDILTRASEKYGISLNPDTRQYRELCNQRVSSEYLQQFDIDRIEVKEISSPRYTLREFGFEERKAKLTVEVPPVAPLNAHLKFLVDERVWDDLGSLEGLSLKPPLSFSSAKDRHLYHGSNDQLELIWRYIQQWYRDPAQGRKWVCDQMMLKRRDWHPLFWHLIENGEFRLASADSDFIDRFRQFFESACGVVGRANREASSIQSWIVGKFVDPDGVSKSPFHEVVSAFASLKDQGLNMPLMRLLQDVGIELQGWSQFEGKKYQALDQELKESIPCKAFQEGTLLGDLYLNDLSLDEDGQMKPIVAVSAGPPTPEWLSLIEALKNVAEKGVRCDETISFMREELPNAKVRGESHMRQAVQTLFRELTVVLDESELSYEEQDVVYEAADAYLKHEMSMELFWPRNKQDYGSEWDHWLDIEEDSGGQEFDCRVPGLKDRESNRPLLKAQGNVV